MAHTILWYKNNIHLLFYNPGGEKSEMGLVGI
jgi:hypothetical protein